MDCETRGLSCGDHVMIGAGTVVKEEDRIPSNVVVAGNPARVVKPLSKVQRERIRQGVRTYQHLARRYKKSCVEIR